MELVKNKFGRYPHIIRSDNGGEYCSKDVKRYLEMKGVKAQYTVPYSPQQNGVAERKNRSLVEMARCLITDANISKEFWGEAIMTANYLQNILVSSAIESTPYELWENQKPNIKHLQVFGRKGYVLVPKEKRRKLDIKSKMLTFMGYDMNSKGFRMVDTSTKEVTISRDVRFVDEVKNVKQNELKENDNNIEISILSQNSRKLKNERDFDNDNVLDDYG